MRRRLKQLVSLILIPLTRWYLKKERKYSFSDATIVVFPGVFHPGLFHSTKFILHYLLQQPLKGTSLLELGCGSGLISIVCAKAGALVTASDINPRALENCARNARENGVTVTMVLSDLLKNIPAQKFDWVVVNPPYYQREATTMEDRAWNAGANFEYFKEFFSTHLPYTSASTRVLMVMTKATNLNKIFEIGNAAGFRFDVVREKKMLLDERDFLFEIVPDRRSSDRE